MGNWKNRDSKLQAKRTLKQQRKFYESNLVTEKKREENKKVIREQRQEKNEEKNEEYLDT